MANARRFARSWPEERSRVFHAVQGREAGRAAVREAVRRIPLRANGCWYDLTLTSEGQPGWLRRLVGRLETGRDGVTNPVLS